jgi:hypothetical protein
MKKPDRQLIKFRRNNKKQFVARAKQSSRRKSKKVLLQIEGAGGHSLPYFSISIEMD